ncbi:hypothetical protein POVCU2_0093270 [Plasmodium ovale curtisi]|uniref:Uncharacterized protein n=1 Tax=Plasmodium ovale curtisi TaxID=864141 RepID=A0A1A8WMK6_PLAOA|nr:hypothetical protein POVCU1_027690 [Plasmodium ovale curtisi]SBS95116.1 hypothetical protein POVCU2_0093270 [Plasmodium ovale curtisi]
MSKRNDPEFVMQPPINRRSWHTHTHTQSSKHAHICLGVTSWVKEFDRKNESKNKFVKAYHDATTGWDKNR